jgi:hypothetical protein
MAAGEMSIERQENFIGIALNARYWLAQEATIDAPGSLHVALSQNERFLGPAGDRRCLHLAIHLRQANAGFSAPLFG